jgi:transketolase
MAELDRSVSPIVRKAVTTIRMLAVDAVEKAKSGHPGAPLGCADIAYVLWSKYLRFNPTDPTWIDRDRFVLSNGHASMLLYSLLHLYGYDLPMSELKQFRQWESKTPGHPEFGLTTGVEATTGPLGQGTGNAVGMALASRMLRARVSGGAAGPDFPIGHRVFALVSDGDLEEGVSHESASLAGHLGLGNLVYLYDDNHISIEGDTKVAFSEDIARRFEGYGWFVQKADGFNHGELSRALDTAVGQAERPSIIICRTVIGFGAPEKQNTGEVHGSPLGPEETKRTKAFYEWPEEPAFLVPDDVRAHFAAIVDEKKKLYSGWQERYGAWRKADAEKAKLLDAHMTREAPATLEKELTAAAGAAADATRKLSQKVIQKAASLVPALVGGSADLEPSTFTAIKGAPDVLPGHFEGRTFHYGIREHGMGAVVNGLAYHGGFIPYGSTFLIFSDYMRPPIRLAAISGLQSIHVFTHDSVFLGEDGPTHQAIEQLDALRAIPHLHVWRPADPAEVALAWSSAIRRQHGPTVMALSRQKLGALTKDAGVAEDAARRGGYIVHDPQGGVQAVLIATGSEVPVARAAADLLEKQGLRVRVVSMPCLEVFEEQDAAYRDSVLPSGLPRAAFEAGRCQSFWKLIGRDGLAINIDRYGASAPWEVIAEKLGFTPPAVAERVKTWLAGK